MWQYGTTVSPRRVNRFRIILFSCNLFGYGLPTQQPLSGDRSGRHPCRLQLACRRQMPSFAGDKSGVKLFHHDGATCSRRAISGLPPVENRRMVGWSKRWGRVRARVRPTELRGWFWSPGLETLAWKFPIICSNLHHVGLNSKLLFFQHLRAE